MGQELNKVKTLFIAANPLRTERLQLDEEIRAITEKIRATEHRDLLELVSIWAARPDDLLQSLNMHKPQIVHFSGHGSRDGEIVLVDDRGLPRAISTQAIRMLFTTLKDNVRVIVLNACYSRSQAEAITEVIDCAIGMNGAIGDRASITFASSFYRAIGFGRSVQEAFDQGVTALLLAGVPGANKPDLLTRTGVDPSQLFLVVPSSKEGGKLLRRGQDALLRNDYISARRDIEKALEVLDEEHLPDEVARAKYLFALAQLDGKRPFVQARPIVNSVESLLRSALTLRHCWSYILTLAIFKLDVARNGLPHLVREADLLITESKQVSQTSEDRENLKLLSSCQPHLVHDYLGL